MATPSISAPGILCCGALRSGHRGAAFAAPSDAAPAERTARRVATGERSKLLARSWSRCSGTVSALRGQLRSFATRLAEHRPRGTASALNEAGDSAQLCAPPREGATRGTPYTARHAEYQRPISAMGSRRDNENRVDRVGPPSYRTPRCRRRGNARFLPKRPPGDRPRLRSRRVRPPQPKREGLSEATTASPCGSWIDTASTHRQSHS